ncbi:MAG: glycogen synthase [Candidatus Gastranaerophilales bacterium]|nr:glycogen synthase [Candidatus Gastranaerophilales bacterium]
MTAVIEKKKTAKSTSLKQKKQPSKPALTKEKKQPAPAMKVLITSSEVAPFSKVGGLADVAGELPPFLEKLGAEVAVFTPLYGCINQEKWGIKELENSELKISMGHSEHIFKLKMAKHPKSDSINIFFVDNPKFFSCFDVVYPMWVDEMYEQERYVSFSLAVLEYAKLLNFKPDIIQANDWHTAMIPVYLKTNYKYDDFYKNTKSLFTIHNLAYQGSSDKSIIDFANMRWDNVWYDNCLEHYGKVNWVKGAIYCADMISTVSPRYAVEILGGEMGEGMDYTLRGQTHKIRGILNGTYYDKKFNLKEKPKFKKEVQKLFGLPENPQRPLVAMISRLVYQKGLDLIDFAKFDLMNIPADFVFLGTGEGGYQNMLIWASNNSSNIRAWIDFKPELSETIYKGCDLFLMPSLFEPCGISQLIAMKYGAVPIVRAVGGLDDTIISYKNEKANGFKFLSFDAKSMTDEIKNAVWTYYDRKDDFALLKKNALKTKFTWDDSAQKYMQMFNEMLGR